MKILVDKMVNNPKECYFSKWRPYPPIVEEPGYYMCSRLNIKCNFEKEMTECYCFKEFKNE